MITALGLYARISDDPEDTKLGVGRQDEDGRALATIRGWTIERAYIDNDLSAYKRKVVRPEFERLLSDLAAGRIGGVVAYDLDRLFRQPRDLERMIDVYDERPGLVFATVTNDINLATPDGRTMARVMVAFANKSSADTARRVARTHLATARTGKPVGAWRPFGWRADKTTLDPEESALVREAADRLLRGGDLAAIVRDWNSAGVRTTRGNTWLTTTLRAYLTSPRLAGWRIHRGEIALDAEGQKVRGLYEPVLDDEMWTALVDLLTGEGRLRHGHRHGRSPVALLSGGILRCGACGASMRSNPSGDRRFYRCPSPTSARRGCGKVNIVAAPLERLIEDVILARLSDETVEATSAPWPHAERAADVETQIAELMGAYREKRLSATIVFPEVEALEKELGSLRADEAAWLREQREAAAAPEDVASEWPSMKVDEKRAVISRMLRAVVVQPATTRGRFDHARVEIVPHERSSGSPAAARPTDGSLLRSA